METWNSDNWCKFLLNQVTANIFNSFFFLSSNPVIFYNLQSVAVFGFVFDWLGSQKMYLCKNVKNIMAVNVLNLDGVRQAKPDLIYSKDSWLSQKQTSLLQNVGMTGSGWWQVEF